MIDKQMHSIARYNRARYEELLIGAITREYMHGDVLTLQLAISQLQNLNESITNYPKTCPRCFGRGEIFERQTALNILNFFDCPMCKGSGLNTIYGL